MHGVCPLRSAASSAARATAAAFVLAATVLAAVATPAAAAGRGVYTGDLVLTPQFGRSSYHLVRVDVGDTKVTVHLEYRNRGTASDIVRCDRAIDEVRSAEYVRESGFRLYAASSFCQTHLGKRVSVAPGKTLAMTGTFKRDAWPSDGLTLLWHGTGAELHLSSGRIVAGGPTGLGRVLAFLKSPLGWGSLLILLGLVVGLAWFGLLVRRGRLLVSGASAAVAWFAGVHDWRWLLAIATVSALGVWVVQTLTSSGTSWSDWAPSSVGTGGSTEPWPSTGGTSGSYEPPRYDPEPVGVGGGGTEPRDEPKPFNDKFMSGDGPQWAGKTLADEPGGLYAAQQEWSKTAAEQDPKGPWSQGV